MLLAVMLRRLGPKAVFALGITAWVIRYSLFACEAPWPFVILALSFHGVCHVFLAIVAQMYLDARCSKDLRATAQNLLMFITLGIGMPLGTLLAGELRESFIGDPFKLFGIPALSALLVLAAFWKTIKFPATMRDPAPDADDDNGNGDPANTEAPNPSPVSKGAQGGAVAIAAFHSISPSTSDLERPLQQPEPEVYDHEHGEPSTT
jgi:hypothetical protein